MDFDLENPLTHLHQLHSDDASLFLTESDHMLSPSYLHTLLSSPSDFAVRQDTVSFISQVPIFSFSFFFLSYFPLTLFPLLQCCSNSNIDPHLSYLAVNYLDRFFSSQGVPVIPFIHFFFQFSCFFFSSLFDFLLLCCFTATKAMGLKTSCGFVCIACCQNEANRTQPFRFSGIIAFSFLPCVLITKNTELTQF